MAEKPTILKPKEMYELCHGDMAHCTYDLSVLSIDDYDGFFNTLPQLVYKKVKSLRFCNDYAAKLESPGYEASDSEVRDYEYSIKNQKPGYSSYIAKIVSQVLPRTKLLTHLEFDRIPFNGESFRAIADAVKRSYRIKSVSFANTRVNDDDFVYFLRTVSPYKLDNISFVNCQISEKVYDTVREFLSRQPAKDDNKKDGEWRLATLNLDERLITSENVTSETNKTQEKSVERNVRLGNSSEGQKSKAELAVENIMKVAAQVKPASPTNDPRQQNENLKRELNELLTGIQAIKYNDDVYLIGEGALAALNDIRAAEETVKNFEELHGPINLSVN